MNSTGIDKNAAVVTTEELRAIRGETEKKATRKAAMMSNSEIQRIKDSTVIQDKDYKQEAKKTYAAQLEAQQSLAKQRREKMLKMDAERANKVPPTEGEQAEKDLQKHLLSKAQQKIDEEHDDVKHMNKMVLYSKVVTIRDKQLQENKRLEKQHVDEQSRLDLMMEVERLKGLKVSEEREVKKQVAQHHGAKVIIDQIKEREIERIHQRELLIKDQEQMMRQIEAQKQAEIVAAEKKRQRNQALMEEVAASNKVALGKKAEMRQQIVDEDMKIFRYNQEKAAAEAAKAEEARRLALEKEAELARLREMQEKAADRQSEIDALRAKRAREESERLDRQKEIAQKAKIVSQAKEMDMVRKRQFLEREQMMAEQAKAERDDFLRIIERQKEDEMKERALDSEKKNALKAHANVIRKQIEKNTEVKKQERLDYLEEGKRVRQKLEDERLKVEQIKQSKLAGIQQLGIEPKYQTELAKKKIE